MRMIWRALIASAALAVLGPIPTMAQQPRVAPPSKPDAKPAPGGDWTVTIEPGKAGRPQGPTEQRLRRLAEVKSWGYQLRLIDPAQIRASDFDLVVVDHAISAFRRFVRQFTADEVRVMRSRANGGTRIVLSYLSIGEAERYRFYWQQEWYDPALKPAWLGRLNPEWDGNYTVDFWDPNWQALVLGSPESYIERVIAQGFDGIYLDRADIFLEFAKTTPDAEARMVAFLARVGEHARRLKPDFLVVMQNAEELLKHDAVRNAIDGIAKEDLYYGIDHRESRNPADTVEWSTNDLRQAQRAGRRVFLVEYIDNPVKAADARRRAARDNFLLHITRRDLGQLTLSGPDQQEPPAPTDLAPAPAGAAPPKRS